MSNFESRSFPVQPIIRGSVGKIFIKSLPAATTAFGLATRRIKSSFAIVAAGTPVITLDSDVVPSAFIRSPLTNDPDGADHMLTMVLSPIQTLLLVNKNVWFDIFTYDGADPFYFTGFQYPVAVSITAP